MEMILAFLGIASIVGAIALIARFRAREAVSREFGEQLIAKNALLERRVKRLEDGVVKLDCEARRLHAEKRERWGIPDAI